MIDRRNGYDYYGEERRVNPHCNSISEEMILDLIKANQDKAKLPNLDIPWVQIISILIPLAISILGVYMSLHDAQVKLEMSLANFMKEVYSEQDRHNRLHEDMAKKMEKLISQVDSLDTSITSMYRSKK